MGHPLLARSIGNFRIQGEVHGIHGTQYGITVLTKDATHFITSFDCGMFPN
jgi:hypothetical protein